MSAALPVRIREPGDDGFGDVILGAVVGAPIGFVVGLAIEESGPSIENHLLIGAEPIGFAVGAVVGGVLGALLSS